MFLGKYFIMFVNDKHDILIIYLIDDSFRFKSLSSTILKTKGIFFFFYIFALV